MRAWLDRLIEIAVSLLVVALVLRWTWTVLSPLLPVLAGVGLAFVLWRGWLWHRSRW